MKTNFDIQKTPLIAIWEINHSDSPRRTQVSDQVCASTTCTAMLTHEEQPDALELDTQEAEKLIRDVAELAPPIFTITGRDPLKRTDIYYLIRYAINRGVRPVLALNATPLLDRNAVAELKQAGVARLSLSLDASSPELHDLITGVNGSYARTLQALHWANEWRVPVQVTTHLCNNNLNDLAALGALLRGFKIVLWTIAFPVPAQKSDLENLPSASEFEQAFATLYKLGQQVPFKIKTLEAQHYRRYVLQQRAKEKADKFWRGQTDSQGIPGVLPVNEGRATVFISSTGEVSPIVSLCVSAGNVRLQKLADIYRKSELFTSLRDASNLKGKCSLCAFKRECGGSRGRALVITGDLYQEDAACIYRPGTQPRVRNKQAPELPRQKVTVEKP
jgi:radical SAM protein with 4Fe4S-binding SPASM domain